MIELWFRYNWHWLSAAFAFSAGVFGFASLTKFKFIWIYDAMILLFLFAAMAIMGIFLLRMRAGIFPLLDNPHELPRPSFIMMLLFTVGGIFGYFYITVLNLSLHLDGCLIVVEKFKENDNIKVLIDITDEKCIWLCSLQRICLGLFLALSCYYIIQRSKVDASGLREQILTNVLNFIFAVFFFKSVINEAYLLIEDYCYQIDSNKTMPFLTLFCPKSSLPRGFKFSADTSIYCFNKLKNVTIINAEQRSWVNVHARVLRDVTLSIFTELLPILLVCHLLSYGNAMKVARKETMKSINKNNKNGLNILIDVNGENQAKPKPMLQLAKMPELHCISPLKMLSLIIPIISIITWNGSFFLSMTQHDGCARQHVEQHRKNQNEQMKEIRDAGIHFANVTLLLLTRIFSAILFGMVVNWTRKIPKDMIDLDRKAITGADKYLMCGGLFFLAISQICCLVQFVLFVVLKDDTFFNIIMPNEASEKWMQMAANIVEIINKFTELICHVLSTIALGKISALSSDRLKEFKQILAILSICGMFFNASCFFQIYFSLDHLKKLSLPIRGDLLNSIIVLLYEAECLTKIGGYLFNMTSALAWFDIVIRYMEMGYYNIAR